MGVVLSEYFKLVPSIFKIEDKLRLPSATKQVIKSIVCQFSDSEVLQCFAKSPTFSEWIKQYYTFHETGQLLSGFRGQSLEADCLAIFLHKDQFEAIARKYGLTHAIGEHCHTVIHETTHLQSYQGIGAQAWDSFNQWEFPFMRD